MGVVTDQHLETLVPLEFVMFSSVYSPYTNIILQTLIVYMNPERIFLPSVAKRYQGVRGMTIVKDIRYPDSRGHTLSILILILVYQRWALSS